MAAKLPSELTELLTQPVTNDLLITQVDGETSVKRVKATTVGLNKLEWATGIESFAGLSINADNTKFDVGAVTGWIVDDTTTPDTPVPTKITFAGQTGITPTNIATTPVTYVSIDSSGTVVQSSTRLSPTQHRDRLDLGAVVHSNNTTINVINNLPVVSVDVNSQLNDFMEAMGSINISGNIITSNGANLLLDKSQGNIFKIGVNFINNQKDPHELTLSALTGATFRYRLQNSTEYGDTTNVDPDNYDNSGVLTAVANNKFTIQRLVIFSSNSIRIQYGQNVYNTLADALTNLELETFVDEPNMSENGLLLAFLVVKQGSTDFSEGQIINANKLGTTTGAGSIAVTSLQEAYNNSIIPQIVTSALGAVTIQEGTAGGGDIDLLDLRNNAGTSTFKVVQNGNPIITDGTEALNKVLGSDANGKGTWDYPKENIVSKAIDYTILDSDHTVLVDATSGDITITLPLISRAIRNIVKTDSSVNTVIIDGNGANISGQATQTITAQWQSFTIHCDGTNWYII